MSSDYERGFQIAQIDYTADKLMGNYSEEGIAQNIADETEESDEYIDGYIDGLIEAGYEFSDEWY